MTKKKVMFISSAGGHFNELSQLKKIFYKYDYFLVTEKSGNSDTLKKEHNNKIGFLLFGTRFKPLSYLFILFANCFISLYWYIKVKPKYIVTTGAHTAGPMCCIGKIFGSKIIFIESFANINTKSVTGKIIYLFADLFIVQWEDMLKIYPKATYGGGIF